MESYTSKPLTVSRLVAKLPRLKINDPLLEEWDANNKPFNNTYPCVDRSSYIGIEVEVENVRDLYSRFDHFWEIKNDGSLRNNGKEFVTPPIKACRAEEALVTLFNGVNKDIDFSERTSIHVHLNVRTFTMEQIQTFVLTYILFEKVLFSYVHPRRYENIFCVPICETRYGYHIKQTLNTKLPIFRWTKYTALNLLPITEKGTIEFRHLHGTNDIGTIINWINIILCIKKFAFKNKPEYIRERIYTLNSTSQYQDLANEVFGPYMKYLDSPDFNKLVESCDSYIKEMCFINPFASILSDVETGSSLDKYINEQDIKPKKTSEDTMEHILRQIRPNFTATVTAL